MFDGTEPTRAVGGAHDQVAAIADDPHASRLPPALHMEPYSGIPAAERSPPIPVASLVMLAEGAMVLPFVTGGGIRGVLTKWVAVQDELGGWVRVARGGRVHIIFCDSLHFDDGVRRGALVKCVMLPGGGLFVTKDGEV